MKPENKEEHSIKSTKHPRHHKKQTIVVIGLIVGVAVCALGAWLLFGNTKPVEPETVTVEITDEGLAPQSIRVKKGTVIVWDNNTQLDRRIAAEPYPTGESLPELDSIEPIKPGESYSFQIEETGTVNYYVYEDPLNVKGTIIVE